MLIHRLLPILFLALFQQMVLAQGFDSSKLDSLLQHIDANDKGMFSLSIFEEGNEVYQKTIGFVDVENKIKADANTKYRIGSITKTFTATLIMKLVENGQLTLDTKLSDFFPGITNSEKITIEHLLRHRSGLFNFTNSKGYVSWMEKPITKKALVEKIKENGVVFEPDAKAEYSNSNYVLLGQIAEKITEKTYPELIKEVICKPCRLTSTLYGGKIDKGKNQALSYRRLHDWQLATETDTSVPAGAGAMISTPTELNSFFTCLFKHQIVNESTLNTMTKMVDGFGIGMFRMQFSEKSRYGHNGGLDGFLANASFFPETGSAVAITSNGISLSLRDILTGALSIYFGKAYEFPVFKAAIAIKEEELTSYIGTYGSPSFPLKITIFKKGNTLYGQATGQGAFPMEALGEHQFRFEPAGLKITFAPNKNTLVLYQGGGEFKLQKEGEN